jgi:hypothetical protein
MKPVMATFGIINLSLQSYCLTNYVCVVHFLYSKKCFEDLKPQNQHLLFFYFIPVLYNYILLALPI